MGVFYNISRHFGIQGKMATLYSIGGPPDDLSKSAHLLHPELASIPVLRNMIALRSLSRHSMISDFNLPRLAWSRSLVLNGECLVCPPLSPPRLPIDARMQEKPE